MRTASDGVCAGVVLEVLWAQAGHVGSHVSKGGTGVSANQSGVGVVVGFPAALSLQTPCPSAAQEIIIKWMWTWEEMLDAFEQEGKGPVEEIKVLLHPPRAANTIRDFVPPSSWGCNPEDECMEVSRAENPDKFDQVVRDLFTPPLHILKALPAQRQVDSYSVEVRALWVNDKITTITTGEVLSLDPIGVHCRSVHPLLSKGLAHVQGCSSGSPRDILYSHQVCHEAIPGRTGRSQKSKATRVTFYPICVNVNGICAQYSLPLQDQPSLAAELVRILFKNSIES
jgi:hypothetical protein